MARFVKRLATLCGLAKHKNVTVKLSAYYALGGTIWIYLPMIKSCIDAYGVERLMWVVGVHFRVVDVMNMPVV